MPVTTLDPANSIIFLGSGFSAGSTNIAMQKVPAGYPLLKRLAEALGENPEDLDLKSAADEFLDRSDLSLYNLLYETFTISELLPHQREILSLPWARIYTTNYDDIINVAKGPNFPIYTFDDQRPRKLPTAFGVHLHGSIRRATEENADNQLILNSKSYDIITNRYPDWFQEFQRDHRRFDACYFMGFSLNDHHISGILTSGEESKRRTYFIAREDAKQMFIRRASEYGEVVTIGFDNFANLSKKLPKPETPQDLSTLRCFKHLRPGIDSKALAAPTPVEIINLVTFGTFNQTRYFNTPTDASYVSSRSSHVEITLDALKSSKTILIHSRLGNGKTIFTSVISRKAAASGYKCLLWRRSAQRLSDDLDIIAAQSRILIIFDDYDAAIDNIERVSHKLPNAKFIVTVRTSQQEVRLHEIIDKLPSPVKRIDINAFTENDKEQLLEILDKAGARADNLEETVHSTHEVRDIVTRLYNNSSIRDKIYDIVGSTNPKIKQIITLSCLIKSVGVDVSDNYLQELCRCDVYAELRKSDNFTNDLLDVQDEKVKMRSSLFSEYLIQRILNPKDILDGCYEITVSSTRRKVDRIHRRLCAQLMKLSTLQRFLKFHSELDGSLEDHYVRLSNDKDVNNEPLFWLQYAILMKTTGNISNAKLFLRTGYERAGRMAGFKTFQLDTQALSIYLMEEMMSQAEAVEGLENIISHVRLVSDMIAEESHRQYAIEVIGEVPLFVNARYTALKDPEKIALVFEMNRAIQNLAALPPEERAFTGSEIVRAKIEGAISKLIGTPVVRNEAKTIK